MAIPFALSAGKTLLISKDFTQRLGAHNTKCIDACPAITDGSILSPLYVLQEPFEDTAELCFLPCRLVSDHIILPAIGAGLVPSLP